MTKIIFITLFFCWDLSALDRKDNQIQTNYFASLPNEIQDHIASFLPYPEIGDAIRQPKNLSQNDRLKIYIEEGDLKYQKASCVENLIHVNPFQSTRTCYTPASDLIVNQSDLIHKITKFALSPNRKQLIALESKNIADIEFAQSGIWILDLETKAKEFIAIPELFSQSHNGTASEYDEYRAVGYQSTLLIPDEEHEHQYSHHMAKLYLGIAVANNRQIALAGTKNIYSIDSDTKNYKLAHSFNQLQSCVIMNFNIPGNVLKVLSKNDMSQSNPQCHGNLVTRYISTKPLTLGYHFYKRCICKTEQLI